MASSPMKRSVRLGCTAAFLVIVGIVAAGCGSSSTTTSSSAPASTASASTGGTKPLQSKTIAYIQAGDIQYYELSAKGASEAASELGASTKVFDSSLEPTKELSNVQDAIAEKVAGIVLFPLSNASVKADLGLAHTAGIPVSVLYGYSKELESKGAGFVEVEFYDYAKALGEEFKKIVPSGPVAIIAGQEGRSEVTKFRDGFAAGLGSSTRIVAEIAANYSRQLAFNAAQDLIQKYPNLKGLVVGNEDMAIGAASALGPKLSQVAIATQNGSPEGNKYLEEGKFKVTVGASPSQEAALAVRLLADTIEGKAAQDKHCLTPWAVNTPGHIQSVGWEPTAEIIAGALKQPPPCSKN